MLAIATIVMRAKKIDEEAKAEVGAGVEINEESVIEVENAIASEVTQETAIEERERYPVDIQKERKGVWRVETRIRPVYTVLLTAKQICLGIL